MGICDASMIHDPNPIVDKVHQKNWRGNYGITPVKSRRNCVLEVIDRTTQGHSYREVFHMKKLEDPTLQALGFSETKGQEILIDINRASKYSVKQNQ